uniref:Uncharacterized protein n=1 Tax=Oryza brachyantha TaxID=4533 RepID=J3LJV0_ORYBR
MFSPSSKKYGECHILMICWSKKDIENETVLDDHPNKNRNNQINRCLDVFFLPSTYSRSCYACRILMLRIFSLRSVGILLFTESACIWSIDIWHLPTTGFSSQWDESLMFSSQWDESLM